MDSCIYEGHVFHRRLTPIPHSFRYNLFMVYLDLSELGGVFDSSGAWSTRPGWRWAVARFLRSDHLGDPGIKLEEAVRNLVQVRKGIRPQGPIRLLTQLRFFGFFMNPISLYYCFTQTDDQLEFVVAEVNNTPWGERHCYVLDHSTIEDGGHQLEKELHVSPFLPMDMSYQWRLPIPGKKLKVGISNYREGSEHFSADLQLHRQEISRDRLLRTLMRYPLMSYRTWQAIYWQALRLWLKKVPVCAHPGNVTQ